MCLRKLCEVSFGSPHNLCWLYISGKFRRQQSFHRLQWGNYFTASTNQTGLTWQANSLASNDAWQPKSVLVFVKIYITWRLVSKWKFAVQHLKQTFEIRFVKPFKTSRFVGFWSDSRWTSVLAWLELRLSTAYIHTVDSGARYLASPLAASSRVWLHIIHIFEFVDVFTKILYCPSRRTIYSLRWHVQLSDSANSSRSTFFENQRYQLPVFLPYQTAQQSCTFLSTAHSCCW